jgi:energy-coupling factor transporter ATP-binding protein EcfA2
LGERKAVKISGLSFRYPTSHDWVLRDVNLTVAEGEFVAITGPSGAGKTTLCMCLNGIIPNTIEGDYRGSVAVFGREAASSEVFEMARTVGITFQEPEAQLFGLTVEEEVAFGPENYGLPQDELEERVGRALELLRLEEFRSKSPYNLSGGQKQRVALASVLALRPRLLVMDEPFTELDPVGKMEVSDAIEQLRKQSNVTIILVEHDAEEIARHADRVVLLDGGRVVLDKPTEEFFSDVPTLHLHGVRCPQVTELFHTLRTRRMWEGVIPTTIEDGARALAEAIAGSTIRVVPRNTTGGTSGEEVVKFDHVSYVYPDGTTALSDVSLSIRRGEYVGLVGQNGSGKTTLARMMIGLLRPSKGSVVIAGQDSRHMSVAQIARKIGYLFQNPDHQIFSSTVFDEVAFGPRNLGFQEAEVRSKVENSLSKVGLLSLSATHPLFSSRGERQRIALASVLSMGPEVLVLDEPTTGQDWLNNIRILDIVDELNSSGTTIVMISHNMQFIAERTRRLVVMKGGSVFIDGPTRDVFSQADRLSEAFIRPPQVTRLSAALGARIEDVPLSVDELAEAIAPLVRGRHK